MTREYQDPKKWLTTELSIGQQLELEQLSRSVSRIPREELEKKFLQAVKTSFGYQNIAKGLLSKNI